MMARLLETEPRSLSELRNLLSEVPDAPLEYSVAVEALVFDAEGRWVLLERGAGAQDEHGKLEGIGGRVEDGSDLRAELRREITEELGDTAGVEIVRFLEVKSDAVLVHRDGVSLTNHWVVVSYVC